MTAPGLGTTERVARNALLKVAVQATRLLSLAFVVFAARALGPERFGKFTFAYALATLLGATLDLGAAALVTRSVARAPATAAAEWATAATLKVGILVPAGLAYALFPVFTHRPLDTTRTVWLLGAALVLQSFVELAVAVFTGMQRLEYELALRLVEKLVLVSVGVSVLAWGGGLVVASGTFVVSGAVALTLALVLIHRRCAPFAWTWRPGQARALARRLGPVAIWFVFAFASTRLVPLLVAFLGGDVAAGHLGAALRVLDVLQVIPVALVAAVYPVLAQTDPADRRFRDVATQSAALLVILALPVTLTLWYGAEWLTRLVYGAAYAPAAPLLAVLGVAVGLGFLNFLFAYVLLALDRPLRLLAVAAGSLAASLTVTPVLVRAAGATGGAVALCLVEGVAALGGLWGLGSLIGSPLRMGALKGLTAALIAAAVAGLVPPGGPGRLGVALLVYGGVAVLLQPVPSALWRRGWRSIVAPAGALVGRSRP